MGSAVGVSVWEPSVKIGLLANLDTSRKPVCAMVGVISLRAFVEISDLRIRRIPDVAEPYNCISQEPMLVSICHESREL